MLDAISVRLAHFINDDRRLGVNNIAPLPLRVNRFSQGWSLRPHGMYEARVGLACLR